MGLHLRTYGAVVAALAVLAGAGGVAGAATVAGGVADAPTGEGTGVAAANATVDDGTNSTLTVGYRVGAEVTTSDAELRVYGPNHHRYYEVTGRSGTVDVTVEAGTLAGGVHRFRTAVVNASPPHDPVLAADTAVVESRSPVVLVSTAVDAAGGGDNVTVTATLRNPSDAAAEYDVAVYEAGSAGPALHRNEHASRFGEEAVRRVVVPAGATRTYALDVSRRALADGSAVRVNGGTPWTLVDGDAERAVDRSNATGRSDAGGESSPTGPAADGPASAGGGDDSAPGGDDPGSDGGTGTQPSVGRGSTPSSGTAAGGAAPTGVDEGEDATRADEGTESTTPAVTPTPAATPAAGTPGATASSAAGTATRTAATPAAADRTATTAPGFSAVAALVAAVGGTLLARRSGER